MLISIYDSNGLHASVGFTVEGIMKLKVVGLKQIFKKQVLVSMVVRKSH